MTSPRQKIADALAPTYRIIQDAKIELLGVQTQILRINISEPDDAGYSVPTYNTKVISDVIISYPFNEVRVFSNRSNTSEETSTTSLDIFDLLPITLFTKYSGDFDTAPVEITEKDIIVDIIRDTHNNKIPIIMECEKCVGSIRAGNIVRRKFELSLRRGKFESALQSKIDTYIANFVFPS